MLARVKTLLILVFFFLFLLSSSVKADQITGSGISNFVPKFTDFAVIANSLIYDNGSSIGIGTTNPVSRFSIKSVSNVGQLFLEQNNQTDGWILFADSTLGDLTFSRRGEGGAGTLTEKVRITNTGNVGIGTTNISHKFYVEGNVKVGNGSALILGSGNTAPTGVSAGSMYYDSTLSKFRCWEGSGWTNCVGSSSSQWTTSGLNIYYNSGNVGIGTTNPGYKLDVAGDTRASVFRDRDNSSYYVDPSGTSVVNTIGGHTVSGTLSMGNQNINNVNTLQGFSNQALHIKSLGTGGIYLNNNSSTTGPFVWNGGGASALVTFTSSGNVAIGKTNPGEKLDIGAGNGKVDAGYNWLTTSDLKLKTNVTELQDSLSKILQLRGVRYDLKTEKNIKLGMGKNIGVIAQELEKQYPELVETDKSGTKAVAYDKMTAVLLQAIKEQQRQIDTLKKEVENLKRTRR